VKGRLFKPFSQGPQTLDRSGGGLGLGLAMVQGLVDLHGGSVGVTSAGPGTGSEFTIRLPLAPPAAVASTRPNGTAARLPRRVLIIEDNVDAAESLRDALRLGGHQVEVSYDAVSGLQKAREFGPDVIVCDIGLPGMSGYEAAQAIRTDPGYGSPWLIALSGYALPEDVRHALQAGFDRHVAKPLSVEHLEVLLAELPVGSPRLRGTFLH
jgi:two-component system CheB/CheR fusion protein